MKDITEVEFDPKLIKNHSDLALALRYGLAWIRWALTGFSYRPQEKIDEIHETKCKLCPYYVEYNEDEGECGICGCPLNKRRAQDNKIAYVSAHCDIEQW